MPMLQVTVTETGAQVHGTAAPIADALPQALAATAGKPVTIMIHGYKYLPGHPVHCPHQSILSKTPRLCDPRIVSWPRHLGLRDQQGEGLGLSFGWSARGTLWQAHRRAADAGDALADLLGHLRAAAPHRPVHIVAHSLGARVALRAVSQVRPGAVQRAILLSAAEYGTTAQTALASPGGRSCEVLNVTSRENDLFDFAMERLIAAPAPGDRMMGHGGLRLPNLQSLQLDDPHSRERLRCAGFPIAPPTRAVCHWSSYVRAGLFPLYRAFLDGRMPLERLRLILPQTPAPRWSRLRPTGQAALWPHRPFRAVR